MAVLFDGGRVFIGDGRVLENAGVLVRGDRIVEVFEGAIPDQNDVRRISLQGKTLCPGFIDCHVHLCMDAGLDTFGDLASLREADITLLAAENAKKTIEAGITSIRDLGGKKGIDLVIRDAILAGRIKGPRMQAAGEMICMTGGTGWPAGREADGPAEVRKAVREQLKAGVDVIKIMATGGILTPGVEPGQEQYTEEELRAGIEEAHKAGRRVATHAQGAKGIRNAVRAGVDTVEHGFYIDEKTAREMADRNVAFLPTLAIYAAGERAVSVGLPREEADRRLFFVREDHFNSVRAAREAGVRIALGTDAGTAFNFHGENLVELKFLVALGFSTSEALQAATREAARVMGWEDRLGTVEVGKLADLVVVDGNPLEDIELLFNKKNIHWVMQGGRLVKTPPCAAAEPA